LESLLLCSVPSERRRLKIQTTLAIATLAQTIMARLDQGVPFLAHLGRNLPQVQTRETTAPSEQDSMEFQEYKQLHVHKTRLQPLIAPRFLHVNQASDFTAMPASNHRSLAQWEKQQQV
jgi:hypothetical protein